MSTEINIKKRIAVLEESAIITADVNSIDFVGSGVNASTVDGDVTVTIPGGSGNTTYYLNQTVDQAPYKEFSSIVASAVEQVIPLTVLAGATSVIAEYQTPSNIPGTTQIPGGLWQFFLHFDAVAAGQNWIIRPTVYKRDLGGTETLIFTPDPEIVTGMSTTTTMYVSDGVFPATTLLTTDRIVVKINVENTTGVSQTVNFRTEGSQHYSVGLTTLNQVIPTGAVTSVTGTAPVVSSGGLTPAISIAQASAIADGYLSSSDFAVFNAKVPATRNITINGTTFDLSADRTWNIGTVTGSGTTNYLSKFTGSGFSIGDSIILDNGTVAAIGNTVVDVTKKLLVQANAQASAISGYNTYAGSGTQIGVDGQAYGTNIAGKNVGVQGAASTNSLLNIGVSGITQGTSVENIGGKFAATGATSNYSLQLTDGTEGVGKVLTCITSDGKAQWATPSSTSGVCGIANASGVYTYYATLSLAMTAAVSGQTVEMFADIAETGSVTITLKNGVNINGNGHTYTLSVNDGTNALTFALSGTVELYNLKVVRTGRTVGTGTGNVLSFQDGNAKIKCFNASFLNDFGYCCVGMGIIYNAHGIGYLDGMYDGLGNVRVYDSYFESTGTGTGINTPVGFLYNSTGRAVSGNGIASNGEVYECTGISTSGIGISAQRITNCTGISTSGTGLSGEGRSCVGISTSGIGGSGTFYNSTLISSSNYGATATLYNSYTQSTSSVATNSSSIYNSTVRCLWNNVGGHCTSTNALGAREILNSFLEVTNASAYCITGYPGSTWKYSSNVYKGSTTAVNSTNIIQGITNTSDNQGNILI
jgi:hypothetical protein